MLGKACHAPLSPTLWAIEMGSRENLSDHQLTKEHANIFSLKSYSIMASSAGMTGFL